VSEVGELAAVLGPGSVLLVQASTPAELRLIRERVAAAGAADQVTASLGSAAAEVPGEVLDRGEDTVLVPVRVAWLPEEHSGRRAARLADMLPGRDPYRPSERQQQRILARQPTLARTWPAGPRSRWTGPSTGCAAPGTRRPAW
jgi:glycerol-3-phosphate O-acyltransferase